MFVVKTKLGPSSIHGIGVFAVEFIPKGDVVWQFHNSVDRMFAPQTVERLPKIARAKIHWGGWVDAETGMWIYSLGHNCFVNHSDNANLTYKVKPWYAPSIAARDIQPDEEITDDYRLFDARYAEGVKFA